MSKVLRGAFYASIATKPFKVGIHTYQPGEVNAYSGASCMGESDRDFEWPPVYEPQSGLITVRSYLSITHAENLAKVAYERWLTLIKDK